ncbi:MAG: hypothetical protein JST69_10135, partial [Bacteroidetes bacterium]|nr:hypothetical protein [Bacteroidota bacterium]
MDFNWRSPIFTRLAILSATVFVLGYSLADKFNLALWVVLLLAIAFQVVQLIRLIENYPAPRSNQFKPAPDVQKQNDLALFFKNIVQHIGIGIITFSKDGIILTINAAAKRMLQVDKIERVDELEEMDSHLVDSFLKLKTGGRELIRIKRGVETLDLSLYAIELTLRGEPMKLISMSNIQ